LTATLKDGSTLTEKVLVNRGGPQNPLTDAELAIKFESNVSELFNQSQAQELAQIIFNFASNKSTLQDLEHKLDS
jgi:2-methylcitrate dehydratase PrpD